MNIICTKENLEKGLHVVSRMIGKNLSLPILNYLLLETDNGRLKISATNLEMGAVCWVGCRVEEEGRVNASPQLLQGILKGLDGDQVSLSVKGQHVVVSGGSSHSEMGLLSVEDFPSLPKAPKDSTITLSSEQVQDGLSRVLNACAQSETRPEISGVYISYTGEKLVFVSTDSYRLAEFSLTLSSTEPFSFILPVVAAQELMRLAADQTGDIEITVSENQAFFSFSYFYITSRLIEGQYPDYTQIIPSTSSTVLTMDRRDLVKAIKSVALFSDKKTNDVRFAYDGKSKDVTLTAVSSDAGTGKIVRMPMKSLGESQEIVVNHRYLLDGLSNIATPGVSFEFNSSSEPVVLRPEDAKDYIYLLMPIHL